LCVNAADDIWRWNGTQWSNVPGKLVNVAVTASGAVWGVTRSGVIYTRVGEAWTQVQGGLVQVEAASPGVATVFVPQVNMNIQPPAATAAPAPATVIVPQVNLNIQPPAPPTAAPGTPIVISGGPGFDVTPNTTTSASTPTGQQLQVINGPMAYKVGALGVSAARCGVSPLGLCAPGPAEFEGNASNVCAPGTFMDIGKGSCWSCPSGFDRSAAAVDTDRACQRREASQARDLKPATFRGLLCPVGTFHDPIRGGECWSCPQGYQRSAAHVEAGNACFIPAGERFSGATRGRRTVWPHECTGGSFHDIFDGGGCWTCPGGFRRTATHITDGRACAQSVGEQQAHAGVMQKAQCGPGEFFDMKIPGQQNFARGGGCYTCPVAYDRTIFPVDGPQACEHPAGLRFAKATQGRPLTCPAGQFFDPIDSNHPSVRTALARRNGRLGSSPVPPAAGGGSCWTCPPGWKRSIDTVFGPQACIPPDVVWVPAPYNQPGLFGLDGAEAVALRLVRDRTAINAIIGGIRTTAAAGSLSPTYARDTWEEIATSPQTSEVLKVAVYARLIEAAANPAAATPEELLLHRSVVEQIRLFRVFIAQNGLEAYRAWKANESYRSSRYAQSQLQVMTGMGEVPPDFDEIAMEAILGGLAASGASSTAIALALTPELIRKKIFPYSYRTFFQAQKVVPTGPIQQTSSAFQGGGRLGSLSSKFSSRAIQLAQKGAQAGAKAGSGISGAAASIGPQIIITIGIMVLQEAIEQQIAIASAEPNLLAGLGVATNFRVDFARLVGTEAGVAKAEGYWAELMAGPAMVNGRRPPDATPANPDAFRAAAQAAMATL
jgi:hypothetical protein